MIERRVSTRHRSFLKGCVYYNNKLSSVECLVRDMSEGGARLKFPGTITIPDQIELRLPVRDETYRAKVQWRAGEEVGVAFQLADDSPSLVPGLPMPDIGERLSRLEKLAAAQERKIQELLSALHMRSSAI